MQFQRFSGINERAERVLVTPRPALTTSGRNPPMASPELCLVRDCGNRPAQGRLGFCGSHYKRYHRYGTPNAGPRKPYAAAGEPIMWLLGHVHHQGDDCLHWPFAHRGNGYGIVTVQSNTRGVSAHRHMCELAHGPAPTPQHLAVHRCGKGHKGCVNPNHLRWATPAENAADRVTHGTEQRGEKSRNAKLTEADVVEMRASWPRVSQNQLARRYGVNQATIWKILHRKSWAWLA